MQTYPMTTVPFEDLTIAVWFTHGIFENGIVDRTSMGTADATGGLAEFVSTAKSKNEKVSGQSSAVSGVLAELSNLMPHFLSVGSKHTVSFAVVSPPLSECQAPVIWRMERQSLLDEDCQECCFAQDSG